MAVIVSMRGEIIRVRTVDGTRWRLDMIAIDDLGQVARTTATERDTPRAVLVDAIELERRGIRVSRGGAGAMIGGHGFTNPLSPEGLRRADAVDLGHIEEAMGMVAEYSYLARDYAKLNDLSGLEYDMQVARAYFRATLDAFKCIRAA